MRPDNRKMMGDLGLKATTCSAPARSTAQLDAFMRPFADLDRGHLSFQTPSDLRLLIDELLHQGWCARDPEVRRRPSIQAITTIEERQISLDEFEQPSPGGRVAWPASNARAGGTSLPFVDGSSVRHTP